MKRFSTIIPPAYYYHFMPRESHHNINNVIPQTGRFSTCVVSRYSIPEHAKSLQVLPVIPQTQRFCPLYLKRGGFYCYTSNSEVFDLVSRYSISEVSRYSIPEHVKSLQVLHVIPQTQRFCSLYLKRGGFYCYTSNSEVFDLVSCYSIPEHAKSLSSQQDRFQNKQSPSRFYPLDLKSTQYLVRYTIQEHAKSLSSQQEVHIIFIIQLIS